MENLYASKRKPHRSEASDKLGSEAILRKRPVVKFNPETCELTVDGLTVNLEVFAKIFSDNPRLLWRFIRANGQIDAVAFDERHVIWLDQEIKEVKDV
jgi:hypothetical protein